MSHLRLPADASDFAGNWHLTIAGTFTFSLLSSWQEWLHRRVETVRFLDNVMVRRSVSVDFSLAEVRTPFRKTKDGKPICLVPLTLMKKGPLTNFDLRDEGGRSLPLVSRLINGAVAAAALHAGGNAFVGTRLDGAPQAPQSVLDDLWTIANERPETALRIWQSLGAVRDPRDATEREWRRGLIENARFMSLAVDLARNFIVMTPLHIEASERRVIKFSYDEVPNFTPAGAGDVGPRHDPPPVVLDAARSGTSAHRAVGQVVVGITVEDANGQPQPVADVAVGFSSDRGDVECTTDGEGLALAQLPATHHRLTIALPSHLIALEPIPPLVTILPGKEQSIQIPCRRVRRWVDAEPSLDLVESDFWTRRKQSAWILAKRVLIDAPAIGWCRSFHLEFEGAKGMQLTRAVLTTGRSYGVLSVGDGAPRHTLSERVHLHCTASQGDVGVAAIDIRPRPSLILRGATLVAALTTFVIGCVALRWKDVGAPGPMIALLLVVPGALSAYVARAREDPWLTEILTGLRAVALLPALWSLLAAMVVTVGREVSVDKNVETTTFAWWAPWTLLLVLALSMATVGGLWLALWRAHRPPEHTSTFESGT